MTSFKQRDVTDCGAACFAWICHHYHLHLPLARLRAELGTNRMGTTAAALVQAASRLGFTAKGVKGPIGALASIPLPAIAHCLVGQRLLHYIVLVGWTPKHARVMDPATGLVEQWSHEKFQSIWTGVLILLAPGESFKTGDHTSPPWRRLTRILRPHKGVMVQALIGAIVTTILGLGMSVYVQKIVDHVIPDGNRPLLNLLGLSMLIILAFRLILGWSQSMLSLRLAQKIDASLILAYYRHLMFLPQSFFDSMRVGEISSRVADAVKIRTFLNQTLLNLILNPLIIAFSLGSMLFWSWKLALVSLALVPVNALLYWLSDQMNQENQRRLMERAADFDAQLVESLTVQPTLRSFRLEEYSILKTEIRLVRLLKSTWRTAVCGLGCGTAANFISQAYLIGLLWLGAGLVLDAGLTPGQLMSCYALASYLTAPITSLIGMNSSIQDALIATDRLFELMDLETERDTGTVECHANTKRTICFEQVCFRYPGRPAILDDFTIVMPAGTITALTGTSGSGKSTVLGLIQRFHVPHAGRIRLGDIDIQYYRLDSLRRSIAVVSQQPQLFTGTILENVAPATPQPDMSRLVQLCRQVGILEFIEKLPRGFFTYLNENGTGLSGGQRQRLALVRALYLDAPVLLLDEPNSALDADAEDRLFETLRRLREDGRTILVSSHTPRMLKLADQVIEIRDGRAELRPEVSATASLETRVA